MSCSGTNGISRRGASQSRGLGVRSVALKATSAFSSSNPVLEPSPVGMAAPFGPPKIVSFWFGGVSSEFAYFSETLLGGFCKPLGRALEVQASGILTGSSGFKFLYFSKTFPTVLLLSISQGQTMSLNKLVLISKK